MVKRKPLKYFEERDYIIDDAFFQEYKYEIKKSPKKKKTTKKKKGRKK